MYKYIYASEKTDERERCLRRGRIFREIIMRDSIWKGREGAITQRSKADPDILATSLNYCPSFFKNFPETKVSFCTGRKACKLGFSFYFCCCFNVKTNNKNTLIITIIIIIIPIITYVVIIVILIIFS